MAPQAAAIAKSGPTAAATPAMRQNVRDKGWWKSQSRGTQNTLLLGMGAIGGLAIAKIFTELDDDDSTIEYNAPVYNRYYDSY